MKADIDKLSIYRKLFEVVGRLESKYIEEYTDAGEVIEIMSENQNDMTEVKKGLDALQRINDKLFDKYGISDEIIDLQLVINQLRNAYDIPDKKELIYKSEDGQFAQ